LIITSVFQKVNAEKTDKKNERRDAENTLDSATLRSFFNFARNFYIRACLKY